MSRKSSGKPGVGRVISAVLVALLAVLPLDGAAQEQAEKLFVRFNGTEQQIEALDGAANRFRSPILEALAVQFAGTAEMDEVFSECREAMGVAPTEERECQMEAARRLSMDLVFEVEINELGRDHWELSLEVWDPHQNMLTADLFVEVEGESIERAARAGLAALASRYLCSVGVEAHCGAAAPTGAQTGVPVVDTRPVRGRLEIIGVDPSPVAVFVDGVEVGTAPGQFLALPLGRVEVTLRAPGYEDLMRNVTLTEEGMEVLSSLSLEPLPATLVVTCNVEGAEIRVDGNAEGETRGGGTVALTLSPGRRRVTITRPGYSSFERTLELAAGSNSALQVTLESGLNAGSGCGERDAPPNTPCPDCEGGRWACSGETLVCQCPGDNLPLACQDSLEIELGEEITVDLCPRPDEMANRASSGECSEQQFHGPEAVYRVSVSERTTARFALWDDDENRAIDTLLYIRQRCQDGSTQIACADDEPCDAENSNLGYCVGARQPRMSVIDTVLEPGEYFIVVDSYRYQQNGINYSCGTVHLETEESR